MSLLFGHMTDPVCLLPCYSLTVQGVALAAASNVYPHVVMALPSAASQVRPFINEAHYFADATLMFPVWPPEPKSVHIDSHQAAQQQRLQQREQEPQHAQRQQQHTADVPPSKITGWGLWLAEHLWIEVERRVTQKRQHMLAEKFM